MKQLLAIAGLGLALTGCMTDYGWSEAPLDDRYYAQGIPVDWWGRDVGSVDIFYSSLGRYGTWGNHARYGRVFLPAGVGPGWQPYSRGYWRNDPRFGRVFVSSDPWGWATYHYGRWGRDPGFGWFWVPDTRFGPSWVDWQSAGGFASWSPLPPPGWSRWGYGWGNDWWVHAPGAWAYRPGMTNHVRRGRWDGHRDRDWDRDWDRRRNWDRDGERDRDRDREWVDRTRPGESPMAGFVRNRVPPQHTTAPPAARPDRRWDERPNPEGIFAAPRREARPRQGGGNPVGGFVRNRVQGDSAAAPRREPSAAMIAPPRATPAEPRAAPPRATVSAPAYRAERPQPAYVRQGRSGEGSVSPRMRDSSQQVSDD